MLHGSSIQPVTFALLTNLLFEESLTKTVIFCPSPTLGLFGAPITTDWLVLEAINSDNPNSIELIIELVRGVILSRVTLVITNSLDPTFGNLMVIFNSAPGGLFERIEKDPNSIYKKLFLGYELGLSKIYDPEYIAQKKLEPEFEREYNLKYLGKVGNVFSPSQIDKAIELGERYSLDKIPINDYTLHSVGVDVGFGSSNTAIVLTEFLKEESKIKYCMQKNSNMQTLRILLTSALTCIESTGIPGFS